MNLHTYWRRSKVENNQYGLTEQETKTYSMLSKIIIIFGTLSWFFIPYQFMEQTGATSLIDLVDKLDQTENEDLSVDTKDKK